jgi:hypothetical protein
MRTLLTISMLALLAASAQAGSRTEARHAAFLRDAKATLRASIRAGVFSQRRLLGLVSRMTAGGHRLDPFERGVLANMRAASLAISGQGRGYTGFDELAIARYTLLEHEHHLPMAWISLAADFLKRR